MCGIIGILMKPTYRTSEQIVETFFDNVDVTLTEEGFTMTLVPSRLRGETATFDIVDQKGCEHQIISEKNATKNSNEGAIFDYQ